MKLNNEKAINTLEHALEYFDMNYDTGDNKTNKELKNAVWDALDYVESELKKIRKKNENK